MASKERRELIASFMDIVIDECRDKELVEMATQAKKYLLRGDCGSCGHPPDENGFRDQLSRDEFAISHTCQSCQDKNGMTDETKQRHRAKNGLLIAH